MRRFSAALGILMFAGTALAAPDFAGMQILPYEPPKPAPALPSRTFRGKPSGSRTSAGRW